MLIFVKNYAMYRFALILVAISLLACRKSDLVKPTVTNITVNNLSQDVVLDVNPGDTIIVRALLQDDTELGQFKIDIHHDFDGHSHKSTMTKYAEIRIKNISGMSYNMEETFIIPDTTASGIYHGTIQALDVEGNISTPQIFYFNVLRSNQPTIEMNLPETISVGSTLNIDGVLSAVGASTHLSLVQIRIRSSKTGNTLLNQTYNLSGSPITWNPFTDGNVSLALPAEENEKIFFRIRVQDSNGNNTIFETEIIIV
jgi:hypothetical protein